MSEPNTPQPSLSQLNQWHQLKCQDQLLQGIFSFINTHFPGEAKLTPASSNKPHTHRSPSWQLDLSPRCSQQHQALLDWLETRLHELADRQRLQQEHHFYRQIAEKSTDMISCHTHDTWTFTYASAAITPLLGYSPEEVVGLPAYELFHPDDARAVIERAPSVIYEKGFYTNTYRFKRKDGSYTWLETTTRSLRSDQGNSSGYICISRDVSRRMRQQLSQQRLASLVEASSDLALFFDGQFHLTYANSAARQLLQLPEELNQHPLQQLFTPQDWQALTEQIEQGTPNLHWRQLCDLLSPDEPIPVELHLQSHHHRYLSQPFFSLLARDRRPELQAEAEHRQHLQELAHISRVISMGELASGLAHELNQPLAAINNYASGSLRRLPAHWQQQYPFVSQALHKISEQAMRAAAIISRMRHFLRKDEYRRQRLDLHQLVRKTLEWFEDEARRQHILINLQANGSHWVEGDPIQIEQILVNLLKNAVDASLESGPKRWKRIQLSLEQQGEEIQLRVQDQGHGIAAELLAKIFEQFFTTKSGGLGMGLAISRSLAEAHNGRLEANSQPGQGSCFILSLPALSPQEAS